MQFRDVKIGAVFFLPAECDPCTKITDTTARDASCAPGFCFSVAPTQAVDRAVPHPAVHAEWFDARHAAAELARTYGHAVLVNEQDRYRVLCGSNAESCVAQAGDRLILANFDEDGKQS